MKKIFLIIFIIIATFLLVACKKNSVKFTVDNFSNGKAGEIILVIDNKYLSDNAVNYIEKFLSQPQPALNQVEPMFNLLRFDNKDFSAHFQRHRSIIQFDINPNFASNTFNIEYNVWSQPQVHIYFRGNDIDSLMVLFIQHEDEILNTLYDNDLKRVQYYSAKNNDSYIEKKIKEKFDINITIPNTYTVAREEDNFIWLRFKTVRNDRFIIVYKTTGNDLSKRELIEARNAKTQAYIPGAIEGAFPIVSELYEYPLYKDNVNVGNISGAELRGLWECVGDKMGGPFYNLSFLDKTKQNIISVDGFVYAPQEDKRDYLREVEAIVKSVK
jgi:hypothetical protein